MAKVISSAEGFQIASRGSFVSCILWTLEGCVNCAAVKPDFEKLAEVFGGDASFFVADSKLGTTEDLEAFPCFDIWRRGHKVRRIVGREELAAVQVEVKRALRAEVRPLTEDIWLLDWQPPQDQIDDLVKAGGKSVLNLRDASEGGFRSGASEGSSAGVVGFDCPILNAGDVDEDYLMRGTRLMDEAPKPIILHCYKGLTAALLGCAYEGRKRGVGTIEVGQWMSDMGPFKLHDLVRVVPQLEKYLRGGQEGGQEGGAGDKKEKKKDKKDKKKKDKKDKKKKDKKKK